VVPQGLDVLFPVVLGGDFRSPLLVISLRCFRDLSLGDLMGEICGNPSWFFGLCFPSQIRGPSWLDFEVLQVLGFVVLLAGFLRFLFFGRVLVGLNLAMDSS
jgi:hypothetical protein